MAVVKPVPRVVRRKFDVDPLHGIYDHGILGYPSIPGQRRVYDFEKMAVKVHGMGHHAAVSVLDSNRFSAMNGEAFGPRVDLAVDGPKG